MKHDSIPPITSRIFFLLEEKKISQSELARVLGIRQSTISGWKQKFNEPEAELLEPISKALNISVEYLVTGRDHIEPGTVLPAAEQQLLDYYHAASSEGQERIMEQAEILSAIRKRRENHQNTRLDKKEKKQMSEQKTESKSSALLEESLKLAELDCIKFKAKMFKSASILMDMISLAVVLSLAAFVMVFIWALVTGISILG